VGEVEPQWTEGPILPWVEPYAPPPAELIIVRGARLVRVLNGPRTGPLSPPPDGHREAVLLAWAPRADRRWAALMAWAGWCRSPRGVGTEAARHGWLLVDETRVRPVKPAHSTHPEIEYTWYGREEPNELGRTIRAAAATLPEQLREAALTPAAHQGP
jgi:hypothetical protein